MYNQGIFHNRHMITKLVDTRGRTVGYRTVAEGRTFESIIGVPGYQEIKPPAPPIASKPEPDPWFGM